MRRLVQLFRIAYVLWQARGIQDYLWGGRPCHREDKEYWGGYMRSGMQKRLDAIAKIDRTRRGWKVEARKRLLQLAAVAIATSEAIDGGCIDL